MLSEILLLLKVRIELGLDKDLCVVPTDLVLKARARCQAVWNGSTTACKFLQIGKLDNSCHGLHAAAAWLYISRDQDERSFASASLVHPAGPFMWPLLDKYASYDVIEASVANFRAGEDQDLAIPAVCHTGALLVAQMMGYWGCLGSNV